MMTSDCQLWTASTLGHSYNPEDYHHSGVAGSLPPLKRAA